MPEKIKSYRVLEIWQRSKKFAVDIYRATENFPRAELYGLGSQMRRAAVSIPSNIAEGFRRQSTKEKIQFLHIAYGSGAELETQLEMSNDLGYIKEYDVLANELDVLMRMFNKTIQSLRQ